MLTSSAVETDEKRECLLGSIITKDGKNKINVKHMIKVGTLR